MQFDARIAKSLESGKHLAFTEHQGLRITAGKVRRTWHYRFKSPVDGRMRQIKMGEWPSVSQHAAVARWEVLRQERDSGVDPSLAKREVPTARQQGLKNQRKPLTVQKVSTIYLEGHVKTKLRLCQSRRWWTRKREAHLISIDITVLSNYLIQRKRCSRHSPQSLPGKA